MTCTPPYDTHKPTHERPNWCGERCARQRAVGRCTGGVLRPRGGGGSEPAAARLRDGAAARRQGERVRRAKTHGAQPRAWDESVGLHTVQAGPRRGRARRTEFRFPHED
eukprot:3052353-Prymnesium_polylepis.2